MFVCTPICRHRNSYQQYIRSGLLWGWRLMMLFGCYSLIGVYDIGVLQVLFTLAPLK